MKRIDLLNLNNVVGGLKIGKVSLECAHALLNIKMSLAEPVKRMGEQQQMVLEELRPEGFTPEDKQMVAEYNNRFGGFMEKYLQEEAQINLPKIGGEDAYLLAQANDLTVAQTEVLMLLKQEGAWNNI